MTDYTLTELLWLCPRFIFSEPSLLAKRGNEQHSSLITPRDEREREGGGGIPQHISHPTTPPYPISLGLRYEFNGREHPTGGG